MKAMWVLVAVVCLAACGGNEPAGGGDAAPDAPTAVDTGDGSSDEAAPLDTDDLVETTTPCTSTCEGKECGSDGCGGSCGSCWCGETCAQGTCEFTACIGKQCGPDGCGGVCGLCPCVGCDICATHCNQETGYCEGHCTGHFCWWIFECMETCNSNDQACLQYCFNQADAEPQYQFATLMECFAENGGEDCPPDDVVCRHDIFIEHCTEEYLQCFPGGYLTCVEMFDCMKNCGDEQACLQGCYNDGTLEAQLQYQAIASCVIDHCGESPTEECIGLAAEDACWEQYDDCN